MDSLLAGLDGRSKQILAVLVHSHSPVTCSSLAGELDVSEKTVRRDLAALKKWAARHSMELVIKPRFGVQIVTKGNRQRLIKELSSCGPLPARAKSRIPEILWLLLFADSALSQKSIASAFNISVNTLRKDMVTVRQWLESRGIRLVSMDRGQVKADCTEWARRLALCELTHVTWTDEFESVKDVVERTVQETQSRVDLDISGSSYYSVIAYLSIALMRIRQGKLIEPKGTSWVDQLVDVEALSSVVKTLEAKLRLSIPETEVTAACAYVMTVSPKNMPDSERQALGAESVADRKDRPKDAGITLDGRGLAEIIAVLVGNAMGMDLLSDETLLTDLGSHLNLALSRIRAGASTYNPFKADLRRMYPRLYSHTEMAFRRVKYLTGVPFSDDEVAYAVMYLGTVLERYLRKSVSCIIVCASGMGVAKFLSEKLMSAFPAIHVKRLVPLSQLRAALADSDVNLVISPVKIPPVPGVQKNVLVVDPMLPAEARALIADELAREGLDSDTRTYEASRQVSGVTVSFRTLSQAKQICDCVSKKMGLKLDPLVAKAIGIHLEFARRRLLRGQVLSQPVAEFRAHYPELFAEVKRVLETVRPFPCESIPDEEVVPIAVYFVGS
ncbi:MAG TPA: PRD domain-containing protein [Firmicutes bacterium]|nr:PRD domain-containing protein [Candidatus Fermentithermobacillaceae bacterium]